MKFPELLFLLVATTVAGAESGAIRSYPLNDEIVRDIPVSQAFVTTIAFPGPLQAIEAAHVTTDPAKPGYFLLDYTPGSHFLAVQALRPQREANLNIVFNRQTYVLRLIETNQPVLAVQFTQPPPPVVPPARPPVSPTRLLGVLQTAKAYPVLARQHPEAVRGVTVARPGRVMVYGDFAIHLAEVHRFPVEDALVFRLEMTNLVGQAIYYRPNSFGIRVGERQFPAALADASGVLPPHTLTEAYFVVAGAPDGGRNELSPRNDFTVLLTRATNNPSSRQP